MFQKISFAAWNITKPNDKKIIINQEIFWWFLIQILNEINESDHCSELTVFTKSMLRICLIGYQKAENT